jgi:hypothetical protein
MNQQEFLLECNKIHGNKYDYSKSIYITHGTKLTVICRLCSTEWGVRPLHHIGKSKSGCPVCANISRSQLKTKRLSDFIKEANIIHNNKYDYHLSNYTKNHKNIDIICPSHGSFQQTPSVHLSGIGCKICSGYKLPDRQISEYKIYKSKVWSESNKSYRKFFILINPENLIRSRTIHLDHKFSISDGFKNKVDPKIIGHYYNLHMLTSLENRSKWDKSSITLEELYTNAI